MSMRESITPEMLAEYTARVKELEVPRKKSGRGMLVFLLICAMFGGVLGFLGVYVLEEGLVGVEVVPPFPLKKSLEFVYLILVIIGFYVMMLIHVIAHEAGHLVFGLLTGYEFLSFRVGSFTIVKKDGKLIRKKIKTPGLAGQCLMSPPEWKDNEKFPYILYNLGGGFMNLFLCLLAVPLFFIHVPFLAWAGGFSIFVGVIFAITNVVPMTVGVPNDGKNCLLCSKSRENQRAIYLQLKMNAMLSDGAEVTELTEDLFVIGPKEELNPLTFFVRLLEYYKYVELGEDEKAEVLLATLEQNGQKLPVAFINTLDLERLYRMLLAKSPLVELAVYSKMMQPVFLKVKDISILRVKYAYLALLSDEEREIIDWLMYSKKGKLPTKLPKRKPETAEQVFEAMVNAYDKHPVIGEAVFHLNQAKKCMGYAEKIETEEVTDVSEE